LVDQLDFSVVLRDSDNTKLERRLHLLVEGEKVQEVETDARVLLLRGREALDLGEVVVVALEDSDVPLELLDVLLLNTEHSCALIGIT
jgi:hypothetical protein